METRKINTLNDFTEWVESINPDEEAILNYSKAIPWNPKDANPYFWRGHAKVSIEQYMKAIDDFDEVIRISGDEASVYHIRGYAKSCLGRVEEAMVDFHKGLQLAKQVNNEKYIRIIENALHELISGTIGAIQR